MQKRADRLLNAGIWLAVCCLSAGSISADESRFSREILPILVSRCGKCHSDAVQRGGLNLASAPGILAGGESGQVFSPASPPESPLWHRIASDDMPPEGEERLTVSERSTLQQWLEAGAPGLNAHAANRHVPDQHAIEPILLLRCKTCHGPQRLAGEVDLRSVAALERGGPNGPLMIPGNAAGSLIVQRIESEACPPSAELLEYFVRRPAESELELLRTWISAGCPKSTPESETAEPPGDPLVTQSDRAHWAFQPPNGDPNVGSIDDMIEQRLHQAGLGFSPEAPREQLIRRLYLDLTGLPPSLADQQRWLQSPDANWFAELVDELLASPAYGERWAVHWLDLAGYADSEGGVSNDPLRTDAWKYRDYVIRSLNSDKPFDRFLLEQLAGDELVDVERAPEITSEMVDNLIATGFLRMGIDETGSRTMNFVPERLGVINDALTVVSSGLMGLTVECARCHSHKYDPIPQRDYYRLKAVFQGALDEHDWLTFRNRTLHIETPQRLAEIAEVNPPLERRLKTLTAEKKQVERRHALLLLEAHYPNQSADDNLATLAALEVADNIRTLPQRELVERLQRVQVIATELQPESVRQAAAELGRLELQQHRLRRQLVPSDSIRALWDRGTPSTTYILRRGEYSQAGAPVQPGVPAVLMRDGMSFNPQPPFPDGSPKTGRRLAFARWLTDPKHPTTARVYVNRLWQQHFGAGLVRTVENFGRQGSPPSHPELLDWLALRFIRDGWSIKQMHRLMLNTRVWRQTSLTTAQHLLQDADNRLFSRMPLRRMDAETLRDSLLAVSGRLSSRQGGLPDPVIIDSEGRASLLPLDNGLWRRSIYAQHRRTEMPTMLATFDYPVMGPNCQSRSVTSTALQPLLLSNSSEVRDLAVSFAERVQHESAAAGRGLAETACRMAFGRSPDSAELAAAQTSLDELITASHGNQQRGLEVFCHALLNSAAFLYID